MRFTQTTVLFSLLAALSTASAQLSETDAPYPTPDAGGSGGSGGLSDPYPYPTESDSLGLPEPTPTAGGSGGADVPYPTESGATGGTGSTGSTGSGGGGGGAGGYAPVPKPSGLEFPVEACYASCTPLANMAESCNYYPIDMDINSACVCSASTQGVFQSCFDCQLKQAPMNGAIGYYQALLDRLQEQCANDNAPVSLPRIVLASGSNSGSGSGSGSPSGSGSGAGVGAGATGTFKPSAARSGASGSGGAAASASVGSNTGNGSFKSNGAGSGKKTAGGLGGVMFVLGLVLWSGAAL